MTIPRPVCLAVAGALLMGGCAGPAEPVTSGAAAGAAASPFSPSSSPSAPACTPTGPSVAAPASGALLGVSLDWDHDTLAGYSKRLGRAPGIAVTFTTMPLGQRGRADVEGAVTQAAEQGSRLLLTLEPRGGLATVTEEAIAELVAVLRAANDAGVPVVVRFAHEMNGSWYPWGQQPRAYVRAFQRVAAAVHQDAPGSGMMWAPSYAGGYPFGGGKFQALAGSRAAKALDTTKDGVVDEHDDGYAPYYPGDEAVDWVGMSLYHWGTRYPWGENEVPVAHKLVDELRGRFRSGGVDERVVPDFYDVYGRVHDKPVAITETGALYAPGRGGRSEMAVKSAWWRQVFAPDLLKTLPRVKMLNWFEWVKKEPEIGGTVDWAVTRSPALRAAFTADLPSWVVPGSGEPVCPGSAPG